MAIKKIPIDMFMERGELIGTLGIAKRMEKHYGWKVKEYDEIIEIDVPIADLPLFNAIFALYYYY